MKFSVPANYDPRLAAQLAPLGTDEVFGKLPRDFAGGGRPSYMGTPIGFRKLGQYVKELRHHGIAFNYLLNAACMGNREWTRAWQRRLTHLLERLGQMGVTRLTVSTPFLLEAIKKRFPQFRVRAGLYALIDSPGRARFWQDLGADVLTLDCRTINRNFARLAAIRQAVKCELQLIANHICLPGCPMLPYHQNGIAHASDGTRGVFVDYCFWRCSRLRLEDPARLIQSMWIRPQDVGAYEAVGIDSLKILERGMPSAALLERVEAYSRRSFVGNLADLLLPYGFREAPKKERFWAVRNFFRPWQIRTKWIRPFLVLARGQGMLFAMARRPIVIDSQKIPADFIETFKGRDCQRLLCGQCGYCRRVAREAVRVDETFRTEFLERYAAAEGAMSGGGLWNV